MDQSGENSDSATLKKAEKKLFSGLNWREIGILYVRETRAALREKSIVTNSILIPLCLYPFLLWIMFTGFMFVQGQTEGLVSRVAIRQWPTNSISLKNSLARHDDIRILPDKEIPRDAESALRKGTLELVVDFLPIPQNTNGTIEDNFEARILCDESKDRSVTAKRRFMDALDIHRENWLAREAKKYSVNASEWLRFTLSTQNVATDRQMGAFLAGMMLPMLFVIMVSIGCFYPAVDCIAGERERHTWETLMSTRANRLNIAVAKYLYVTSFGGLAGLLNIVAVTLTMKPLLGSIMEKAGENLTFAIPFTALPIIVIGGALLAAFVAAGMMIFASFASTFKEGQAMATPFYLLVLLPSLFLQMPGVQLTPSLACVPVVNVTLMIRAAIQGNYPWSSIIITGFASLILIALCLRVAAWIMQFEDVVSGSFSGGITQFLKKRVLSRSTSRTTNPVP